MPSPLHFSPVKIIALLCFGLFLTSLTGWFPPFGGAPGSSGDSYGIPAQWRIRKWRSSTPMYELAPNKDGQLEEQYIPYTGTPGGTRTRYQPLSFVLDVLFWAAIGYLSMLVLQGFTQLISTKSVSKTGRTG